MCDEKHNINLAKINKFMIKFNCPHCEQRISAEPKQSGMTAPCPTCKRDIIVPRVPKQLKLDAQIMEGSIAKKKRVRKKKILTFATVASIMIIFVYSLLHISKCKSHANVEKKSISQIARYDDTKETSNADQDNRNTDDERSPSLNLARYAEESEQRRKASNQKQQDDFGKNGFENSLGMKFVRVPISGGKTNSQNILFSVWETRRMDYRKYAEEKSRVNKAWENRDYSRDESAPVTFVTIRDAEAFCDWLSKKERSLGIIPETLEYRLPTDHEWSCAVGIGELEDPESPPILKEGKRLDDYPWGDAWPIPENFVKTYTSFEQLRMIPVGSLSPNKFGLYDMGGNVSELCEIENGVALGRGASNTDLARYMHYFDEVSNGGKRDPEFELDLKKRFASSSRFIFEYYDEEFGDLFVNPVITQAKKNAEQLGASYARVKELMIKRGQYKPNPVHGLNDFGFRCVLASASYDGNEKYDYYDYKAIVERNIRYNSYLNSVPDILAKERGAWAGTMAIMKTDWSKCSPDFVRRVEDFKNTLKLVGQKKSNLENLAEKVKSLNELSAKTADRLSKNELLVGKKSEITQEINIELENELENGASKYNQKNR
jgi:hypothetical protein